MTHYPNHPEIAKTLLEQQRQINDLREIADAMAHGIESLFSSLPFSAPENVAYLARAKLSGPLDEYRALRVP